METIIRECGLWPQRGLNAQCKGFKCMVGKTDCCCHRVLFTQPDFVNQKSYLEELITSRGHICDFYPKYHCELNFIEQYWGVAKLAYQSTAKTTDMKEMEKNMRECLDDMLHVLIQWWASSQIYWFTLSDILSISSVMPTVQLTLSACMVKAWLVWKQLGQIANIMAITHCPHTLLQSPRKSMKWSMVVSKLMYPSFPVFLHLPPFSFSNPTFCHSWCLYNIIT